MGGLSYRRTLLTNDEPDLGGFRMRTGRFAGGIALAITVGAFAAAAVPAYAATPTAIWEMNEAPGSRVMVDSGPNRLNGSIGSEVQVQGQDYYFPTLTNRQPPTHPQHLVTVPNNSRLNPGTGNYTIKTQLAFTTSGTNIVQKGQSGTTGGYFKLEAHERKVACYFRDSAGHGATAYSGFVDDGVSRTYQCDRVGSVVRLYVNGVLTKSQTAAGGLGSIANSSPFVIGGKSKCDQVKIECDYFGGSIYRVEIDH
jgi:hypothetical protein